MAGDKPFDKGTVIHRYCPLCTQRLRLTFGNPGARWICKSCKRSWRPRELEEHDAVASDR